VLFLAKVAPRADELRRANEILKAASTLFVKELDRPVVDSKRLSYPAGTGEDAPVEVPDTRTRGGRTTSRHRPASEAINAVLVEEFRRS
jgi:hypothetical protein